ncbi:chymotrypsin-2-like [Cloeon dipterum]|uniref:chymotrypsin-2-like n=1 Tax=Cloeon dipterum TaxID=197152 RepID=UPI00322008CC
MGAFQATCLLLIFCAALSWDHAEGIVSVDYIDRYAGIAEFPWQVSIRIGPWASSHGCHGVIISKNWILTTATCLKRVASPMIATCTITFETGIVYEADAQIYHPGFDETTNSNDIVAVKTKFDMNFSDFTRSIRLTETPIAPNTFGRLAGLGRTQYAKYTDTLRMRVAEMSVIDREVCRSLFTQKKVSLGKDQFCAGAPNVGACGGDEGGGFVWQNQARSNQDELVGLVNNNFCALNNFPNAFTNIYHHREWIRNVTEI